MKVSELLASAQSILNDAQAVTYTEPELLKGVSLGCNAVSIHRPDASSTVSDVSLVAGSRQSLPDGGLRILDVLGNASGTAVRLVNMQDIDAALPDWRSLNTTTDVQEVMVDERAPGVFWVYPANNGNGSLSTIYTTTPATVTSPDDDLPVTDKYAPVVLEWLLYLMFSRDSERSPNQTRASTHKQTFFDLLGIKTQVDMAYSPNARVQK